MTKQKGCAKRQKGNGCELNRATGRCEFVSDKNVQSRYCRKPSKSYKCKRNSIRWSETPTLGVRARNVLRSLM